MHLAWSSTFSHRVGGPPSGAMTRRYVRMPPAESRQFLYQLQRQFVTASHRLKGLRGSAAREAYPGGSGVIEFVVDAGHAAAAGGEHRCGHHGAVAAVAVHPHLA